MVCKTTSEVLKKLRADGATVEQLKAARDLLQSEELIAQLKEHYGTDKAEEEHTGETIKEYNIRKLAELKELIGKQVSIINPDGTKFLQAKIKNLSNTDEESLSNKIQIELNSKNEDMPNIYRMNPDTGALDDGYTIESDMVSKQYPIRGKYGFTPAYHDMNRQANKYVADMGIAFYNKSEGILGPKLREFHERKMAENGIYAKIYNTIKDGANEIELFDKLVQQLFLSGDTDRSKIAKLTKMVEDTNRWAMETLTTEMPEWDKKLLHVIKDEKEQILLNEVYGLGGYGAMSQYTIDGKTVMELVNNGMEPSEVLKKLKLTMIEETTVTQMYERLVHRKVQNGGRINTSGDARIGAAIALKTLEANDNAGYKLQEKMRTKHKELHDQLVELAISAYTLNRMVNRGVGTLSVGKGVGVYSDYEEHGLLDLYSNSHEFRIVTRAEMDSGKYDESRFNPWEVLKPVNQDGFGIVYRKSQEVYNSGLGVNEDRIKNGLYIDKKLVEEGLKKDKEWLVKNNVQEYMDMDGITSYRVILTKEQAIKAEGMNNVMQTLYRSVVHNTQLIEQQTARQMIKAQLTEDGDTEAKLDLLEKRIEYNKDIKWKDRHLRKEVKPYLKTNMSRETLKEKYPNIYKEYKIATGVSTYGGLDKELRYVRRGLSDIMIGFGTGSLISDNLPWLQDMERKYKQLVVLKKLKMVVASPSKLMADMASNVAVLGALDVDPIDGGKDMKQAFDYWDETSNMEAEIVKLRMELLKAEASNNEEKVKNVKMRLKSVEDKFKKHPFYEAYERGFVQSMATSMMIKEFDTISGLQHTIDEVVKKITLDDKHKPNEVHEAIVKFMNWGYSVEDALRYAGNASKLKGTRFGDELIAMGDRLANHKKAGEEDVPAYISEIIAGPNSELVKQGSRIMQMSDLMSRWALYKHTLKELLSEELGRPVTAEEINDVTRGNRLGLSHTAIEEIKDKAGLRSLDTFVDYRLNLPSEFKKASDVGVLWFPAFWLRTAVVVPQMIAAKPINTMITLAVSGITGLDTVYESHPLWKAVSSDKSIVHPGMNVLEGHTFIPYWQN